MALTRTLGADEWRTPIEIQNAYWRLIKAAVVLVSSDGSTDMTGTTPRSIIL